MSTKITNFSELSNFSSSSFWGKPLWNKKLLVLIATDRRSCYTIVRPFSTLGCFPFFLQTFWELIFAIKIKTMLLKQSAVLFTSCQKKYCVYYVSEQLKYCSQINEYTITYYIHIMPIYYEPPFQIKTILLKQSAVLFTSCQKNIAYIMCLNS